MKTAKIINRRRETVGIYINMYKNGSLEGLDIKHSPGKPPKLSKDQKDVLLKLISTKVPANVGFIAKYNWTLGLAIEYVKRGWNIDYSIPNMPVYYIRLT